MNSDPDKPQLIVKDGKPVAVIVSIDDYEALLEAAEQAADLRAIRAMKKADWETITFEEYQQSRRRRASA
jgi:prevent-host-death family protein